MSRRWGWWWLPALALPGAAALLLGCPVPPVARPYAPTPPAVIVAALRARVDGATWKSLRSEAKVDYFGGRGERVKVTMTFLVAPPDHIRIDAESPVGGATVASLASDGKEFQLLDTRQNKFIHGKAEPCNIARLIQVRLGPADVVAVVAGGAPLLGEPTELTWDPHKGGREVLSLVSPRGEREIIKLKPRGLQPGDGWDVFSVAVDGADGKPLYRLDHSDFGPQPGGLRLPSVTLVDDPLHHADIKIRYRSVEVDVTVPPNAFHLDPPPGVPIEEVTCQ